MICVALCNVLGKAGPIVGIIRPVARLLERGDPVTKIVLFFLTWGGRLWGEV